MRRPGARRYWFALGVVGLWYLVVLIWAFQPLSETLQVGLDVTATPPSQHSVTVQCNSAFASTIRSEELPVLPPQPEGQQPLAFPREPCQFVRSDARRALVIDTVVLVVAAAGLIWIGFGRGRRDDGGDTPSIVSPGAPAVG